MYRIENVAARYKAGKLLYRYTQTLNREGLLYYELLINNYLESIFLLRQVSWTQATLVHPGIEQGELKPS